MMVFWPKCKMDIIYNSNKSAALPDPDQTTENREFFGFFCFPDVLRTHFHELFVRRLVEHFAFLEQIHTIFGAWQRHSEQILTVADVCLCV